MEIRPANTQLLHLADQRGAFEAEFGGRAVWASDHPSGGFQCVQNHGAFGVLKSSWRRRKRDSLGSGRRQRIGKHAMVGKDDGTFDQILQVLADITRPMVRAECRHGFLRNVLDLPAQPAAENLDKMRHQGRDVFPARPQGWQPEGKNIETVVEVTTKFATLHHLRQVTVRRSDQPNIHLMSPRAAQALELLFLQYAQKFGLQCRRNIAHLVQEKRALVGQLKTANLLRYGSGERASLVTKKLTFQQVQRNGSAI